MVLRGPSGGGFRGGPFHSENPEAWFTHVPGLKVVQPSTPYQAKAMLKAGLFTKFPRPEFALALHTNATMQTGKVGVISGYAMANVDMVDITVFGKGGHGAYPHTTIDPVVLASRMILDFQTIVSRQISPLEPAVLTVGSIHGGTKGNVIPDEVKLELTLRSYSDEVRNKLIDNKIPGFYHVL